MADATKRKSTKTGRFGDAPTLVGTEGVPKPRRVRGDEPTLVAPMTTVLYRPVDAAELAKIEGSGHRRFPRGERAFTVLVDEAHARLATGSGWLTRFAVRTDVIALYPKLGGARSEEYAIPAGEVEALNDAIVGPIVVVR